MRWIVCLIVLLAGCTAPPAPAAAIPPEPVDDPEPAWPEDFEHTIDVVLTQNGYAELSLSTEQPARFLGSITWGTPSIDLRFDLTGRGVVVASEPDGLDRATATAVLAPGDYKMSLKTDTVYVGQVTFTGAFEEV